MKTAGLVEMLAHCHFLRENLRDSVLSRNAQRAIPRALYREARQGKLSSLPGYAVAPAAAARAIVALLERHGWV